MKVFPVSALKDNYIWCLSDTSGQLAVVDPGDARPIMDLVHQGLTLTTILITHHHEDHTDGVLELLEAFPAAEVIGPTDARISRVTSPVRGGEQVDVLGAFMKVLDVRGHTRSHVAFVTEQHVFSGDSLFSLGCGRLFEGDASDLHSTLQKYRALDPALLLCCAHEYTWVNSIFASTVDPLNQDLQERIRQIVKARNDGTPTIPVTLESEFACNPFLRLNAPEVIQAVVDRYGPISAELEILAKLRAWRDEFVI